MPNWASTNYVIEGPKEDLGKFMKVIEKYDTEYYGGNLYEIAKEFNIDCDKLHISARGYINDYYLQNNNLYISTETAWECCDLLFDEINEYFNNNLKISYLCTEPGEGLYIKHDENNHFPEEVCVNSYMYIDDEMLAEDWCECMSIKEAVDRWCKFMKYKKKDKIYSDMIDIINNWKYDDEDNFYNIHIIENV